MFTVPWFSRTEYQLLNHFQLEMESYLTFHSIFFKGHHFKRYNKIKTELMQWHFKILPMVPIFHLGISSHPSWSISSPAPCLCLGSSRRCPSPWHPVLLWVIWKKKALGSWFWISSPPVIINIYKVYQKMQGLRISPSLCVLSFI